MCECAEETLFFQVRSGECVCWRAVVRERAESFFFGDDCGEAAEEDDKDYGEDPEPYLFAVFFSRHDADDGVLFDAENLVRDEEEDGEKEEEDEPRGHNVDGFSGNV